MTEVIPYLSLHSKSWSGSHTGYCAHLLDEVLGDAVHGIVIHFAVYTLLPATLHPHFKEILVKGIPQRSQGDLPCRYSARHTKTRQEEFRAKGSMSVTLRPSVLLKRCFVPLLVHNTQLQ